ncbi:MAG: hypothetical protein PVI06_11655 [Desulfobacterales bacterium]|jgi:hypothetical protein
MAYNVELETRLKKIVSGWQNTDAKKMDKEKLKKLAENSQFISSIYNYCDRWCERCPFTRRCMNFALSEEHENSDPQARDMNNELFWRKLSQTLRATLDLVKEAAAEQGIDFDSIDVEETAADRRLTRELVENHACSRAAKVYADRVEKWFDSAGGCWEPKGESASPEIDLASPESDPIGVRADIGDAVEVVRWYQHLIWVKLMRAIQGELREQPEIMEEFAKDSDGSAKVALIAIDRSISAWGVLRGSYPHMEKDSLDLILHLERLRRMVEHHFPAAREFIRPGFDKIDLNS